MFRDKYIEYENQNVNSNMNSPGMHRQMQYTFNNN